MSTPDASSQYGLCTARPAVLLSWSIFCSSHPEDRLDVVGVRCAPQQSQAVQGRAWARMEVRSRVMQGKRSGQGSGGAGLGPISRSHVWGKAPGDTTGGKMG
eukprot:CAMPEP_0174364122 /NCGR_PEP_ID=MMETSP0811_2-20130205/71621_1 /TAXON_ID=73025 ORGANISM="Eutreptiella gymnastica-like, Strain CCMP1594" /NCGR_SAMPLE_ID=MMETSP0811_2 /ASSEMBLY_ACC=CAM_ASM_000667 /LENGTH=101 /DNA_ID=CAMNT_0015503471 /DNA_START=65 /DNA_END=366 /DNA_ORIENTATION=-